MLSQLHYELVEQITCRRSAEKITVRWAMFGRGLVVHGVKCGVCFGLTRGAAEVYGVCSVSSCGRRLGS